MSDKEEARQVIETLPETATLDDVMHAIYLKAKFKKGEQEIREGNGIPHEQAKERLKKWVK